MKALVDLFLFLAALLAAWYCALSLIRIVFGRSDGPVGVLGMVAYHPEREAVELSDHERDVLLELDVRTEWENA